MRHGIRTIQLIAGTLFCGLAACSDSVGPGFQAAVQETAAMMEATLGAGQSGLSGSRLTLSPVVTVRDGSGQPMAGVAVRFTVTRGGGSVERPDVVTDGYGQASAGSWTLGTAAGANELQATAGTLAAVKFAATATAAPVSAYDITVRFVGTPSARQQASVASAVARWKSVIMGDLSNVPMNAAAGACFEGQPAMNEVVDDLLLYVEFVNIDGAGAILGQAGPCFVRSENNLPVVGYLKLDTSDLAKMETLGTLDDVVLHEIGHVLGIGTLWSTVSLLSGAGSPDPSFSGARALGAYRVLGGGAVGIPVENTGGEGTRDSHWRESEFGNELMTGFISGTGNPLSAMTASSLNDLGYGAISTNASSYTLGGARGGITEQQPLDLHKHEKLERPRYKVDKYGRKGELSH